MVYIVLKASGSTVKNSFFKNCLVFFLSVALVFSALPSMAMTAKMQTRTPAAMSLSPAPMHNCCNGMKGTMPHGATCGQCAVCAACAATYIAPVAVPFLSLQASARYERITDTAIVGKTLMPDTPPPKA